MHIYIHVDIHSEILQTKKNLVAIEENIAVT